MTPPLREPDSPHMPTDRDRSEMTRHELFEQLVRQNEETARALVELLRDTGPEMRAAWWHWLFTDVASPLDGPREWSEDGFIQRSGTVSLLEEPAVTKAVGLLARLADGRCAENPHTFWTEVIVLRNEIAALPATPVPHFGAVRSCVMWCLLDLHTPTPAFLGAAVCMAQQAAVWRDTSERTDPLTTMQCQEHVLARMMKTARDIRSPDAAPEAGPDANPSPEAFG